MSLSVCVLTKPKNAANRAQGIIFTLAFFLEEGRVRFDSSGRTGSETVCVSAGEEAAVTRLLHLDPAEPRESFSSDMVICGLISSCLTFKHNYEMKAAEISAFYLPSLFILSQRKFLFSLSGSDQRCNVSKYIYQSTVLYFILSYFILIFQDTSEANTVFFLVVLVFVVCRFLQLIISSY